MNDELTGAELTFGPAWARQSAEKWTLSETAARQKSRSRPEWRKDRDQPRNGVRSGSRGERNTGDFKSGRRNRRLPEDATRPSLPPAAVPLPEITISFIPERSGLKPLVRQLSGTRRAYSLFEIAATFLSRPEFYAATVEAIGNNGLPVQPLYQCAECKAVFVNKQAAVAHGLHQHVSLFYDKEEKEVEPPQGNFLCVARCALSGILLGPPNYHGFGEKLLELHKTRFAGLPLEQYRKKIVNETDPALIEQWKKEASRKIIYRAKLSNEPVILENNSKLEEHFGANYAPTLIREGRRFVIPATVSCGLENHQLKNLLQEAWKKETRFPINMAIAIQKRFRRLGLHVFKLSGKMTFVSSVRPHPIDAAQTTETLRGILEWIRKNSGKTRQDLVVALVPGPTPEPAAVTQLINSLVWLIDRGHVIEFRNGTLAVPPRAGLNSRAPKAVPAKSQAPVAGLPATPAPVGA